MADAKSGLSLGDILVPCPYHLDHHGTGAQVLFHASFIATAELLQSAVTDEIEQMRVVPACPVTA
jgi:hypothetical protein